MLIYFRRELQERVTSLLHFALRASGILMLGPSESLIALKSDFEALNHRWKIFRKRHDGRAMPILHGLQTAEHRHRERGASAFHEGRERGQNLVGDLFQGLFGRYVEAGFVFDDQQKLIYSFGKIENYTRLPQGLVRLDSLSVIVEGLKSPMMLAIRQAQSSTSDVALQNIQLKGPNGPTRVDLRVFRLESKGFGAQLYAVVIEDARPAQPEAAKLLDHDASSLGRIEELEHELSSTKESLQAAIEELETSNEEMQSTNEELVASNEELQSTNEELQSVNEELHTINTEYQNKIAELTEISADLEEFLNVSDIGTVFLDADLCIRKFTPGVRPAIPIREHDLGRPISDLGNNLVGLDLEELVLSTLRQGTALDREVRTTRGQRFYLRIRPYDPRSGMARGVLLAFVDMTSEDIAREDIQRLEGLLGLLLDEESGVACWSYDLGKQRFDFVSEGFEALWDQRATAVIEDPELWFAAIPGPERERCRAAFAEARSGHGSAAAGFRIVHRLGAEDAPARWVRTQSVVRENAGSRPHKLLGVTQDVTANTGRQGATDDAALAPVPREAATELLLQFARLAPEGLLLLSRDGRVLLANRTAATRLDTEPAALIGARLEPRLRTPAVLTSLLSGKSQAEKLRLEFERPQVRIDTDVLPLPGNEATGPLLLLRF